MKSSTECIEESETYAKNRLARFKEKFGDSYLECSDETAIYLLKHGYMDAAIKYDYEKYKLIEKACKAHCQLCEYNVIGGCAGMPDISGCSETKSIIKAMEGE